MADSFVFESVSDVVAFVEAQESAKGVVFTKRTTTKGFASDGKW